MPKARIGGPIPKVYKEIGEVLAAALANRACPGAHFEDFLMRARETVSTLVSLLHAIIDCESDRCSAASAANLQRNSPMDCKLVVPSRHPWASNPFKTKRPAKDAMRR
jgi:hypothetical protein